PRVSSAGGDGADVQLLPYGTGAAETVDSVASAGPIGPGGIVGCDGSVRPGFAPRWSGLERGSGPDVPDLIAETLELSGAPPFAHVPGQASLVPIGVVAFGEMPAWDPLKDGSVLTVRGSSQSGKSVFAALMHSLAAPAVS